ncbi:hypothetical protein F4780DRAFT_726273 [Xylariomycetidae sp. FL0641]|nr:hypothetical protein F4780DRAFT_726273 [Xylariomycetidae sp. FL0641]
MSWLCLASIRNKPALAYAAWPTSPALISVALALPAIRALTSTGSKLYHFRCPSSHRWSYATQPPSLTLVDWASHMRSWTATDSGLASAEARSDCVARPFNHAAGKIFRAAPVLSRGGPSRGRSTAVPWTARLQGRARDSMTMTTMTPARRSAGSGITGNLPGLIRPFFGLGHGSPAAHQRH